MNETPKHMFGLDYISWNCFLKLIAIALFFWYLSLLVIAWWKSKAKGKQITFEDQSEMNIQEEQVLPIQVSSKDFSTELLSPLSLSGILPAVSFQEEMGMDEGFELDAFLSSEESVIASILNQIQYQQ